MTADTFVAIRSPADLLAAVPYMLGFHPADSLVVVAATGSVASFAIRFDLPPAGSDDPSDLRHVAAVVARQGVAAVTVIGYGPPGRVTPAVERFARALAEQGVTAQEMLRVTDGRYWSYTCPDPRCCPAEGRAFDPGTSAISAAATFAGAVALPDRASMVAQLAPVGDTEPATAAAERRLDELLAGAEDASAAITRAGRAAVRDASGRYRGAGELTADEAAWLGLLLVHVPTRDHAWEHLDDAPWQLQLWTDVTRRVDPGYVPAPACLLAFAAWRVGHGALATVAVERALQANPDYSMAQLLDEIFRYGIPPSELGDWAGERQ